MAAFDDGRLLALASFISDGEHVNWAGVRSRQDASPASGVLNEMALIDRIASFYRSTQSGDTPTGDRGDEAANDPQTWGHFSILERIGSGAFGTVYRAKDTKLQSDVALKLLWPKQQRDAAAVVTSKEARLLARVRHENVVTVHGTDYIDGRLGIWMEFVRGRTLAAQLQEQGPFSAREAANIGFDLCRALAAVHRAGLLHGDVKAHNVMRAQGGRTVLMDFGTGKDLVIDSGAGQPRTNDFAGTPLYVAPEVFEGRPRTRLTDIYSLGVLLYHLVTDAYPVDGRTRVEVAEAHRRGDRKYLRDVRPDLPPDFVAAVERALSVDPKDRYQSAGAFEAALAPIIGRKADEEVRLWWTWMQTAAAAMVMLALGGALAYWVASSSARNQPAASTTTRATDQVQAPSGSSAATETEYQVDTALYRARGAGEERLRPGAVVHPGDQLFAKIRVSVPAYVYIVNEDEAGESFLEFPLPGQRLTNPVPAATTHRIPSGTDGEQVNWQVTTAGGREHFLIFVSPERLPVFEQMFAALPRPELGKAVQYARLSQDTVSRLRGIGGLAAAPTARVPATQLASQFSTPLGDAPEIAHGLWVRQFTVENPR